MFHGTEPLKKIRNKYAYIWQARLFQSNENNIYNYEIVQLRKYLLISFLKRFIGYRVLWRLCPNENITNYRLVSMHTKPTNIY
jgi:hypothetical protein